MRHPRFDEMKEIWDLERQKNATVRDLDDRIRKQVDTVAEACGVPPNCFLNTTRVKWCFDVQGNAEMQLDET